MGCGALWLGKQSSAENAGSEASLNGGGYLL